MRRAKYLVWTGYACRYLTNTICVRGKILLTVDCFFTSKRLYAFTVSHVLVISRTNKQTRTKKAVLSLNPTMPRSTPIQTPSTYAQREGIEP